MKRLEARILKLEKALLPAEKIELDIHIEGLDPYLDGEGNAITAEEWERLMRAKGHTLIIIEPHRNEDD